MSDKPMRAKSPYNFFYQEQFQEIQEIQDPDFAVGSYTPIFLLIANRWRHLNDNDKVYYEELAEQDKRRYMNEMAEWHRANQSSSLDDLFNKPYSSSGL